MAIVAVQGEVDMSTALEMDAELARLVDAGWANIVVDLAGVSFIDSTGLRANRGRRHDLSVECFP